MKKSKYLQAIYNLIVQHGFNTMRMEEIAEKIGITKMTIYNNFDSKENLFRHIISYRSTKFLEFISSASKKHSNAIDELMGILKFQKDNPLPEMSTYYSTFLAANPRVYSLYKTKFRNALKKFVADNIRRGVDEGIYIKSIDPEHIANFTISTMDNMMYKWLKNEAEMDLNITHEHIILYHIRGIANPAGLRLLEHYKK